MTIEQKAKAYDEALERAKRCIEEYDYDKLDNPYIEVFPELGETEDEKMMKQLHSWMLEFGGAEEYTEKVHEWMKDLISRVKTCDDAKWTTDDTGMYNTAQHIILNNTDYSKGTVDKVSKWLSQKLKRSNTYVLS